MHLAKGARLGCYEIVAPLGSGGMGEVYRALDHDLQREVAIKILPSTFATHPERLARFEREARAVAALSHPGVVTIHTIGKHEGAPFLAMELVRGETLEHCIEAGGVPLERFFAIALPLADALAAAHEAGVTHRDLKPANVMFDERGQIKILDFGLARLTPRDTADTKLTTAPLTTPGSVMGTAPYMAPEQFRGEADDARSDLFSLGVLLYELATGERPFLGTTPSEILWSIASQIPAPLKQARPDLPRQLDRIIQHCLQKEPSRRFQSARDVHNELESLQGEMAAAATISANASGGLPRSDRPAASSPTEQRLTSLAVLPLRNLADDESYDFFVDGLTEAVITDLAKLSALKVISRASAMQYKGVRKPPSQIGEELGVGALVEGSVLRVDDRVRITVELSEAASGRVLWAETYDRHVSDILALQSDVARAIATEIQIQLTPSDEHALARSHAVDPQAHEAYWRGKHFWNKRTPADLRTALRHFHTALDRDPGYALAYVGLAEALTLLERYGVAAPPDVMPQALAAAKRAAALDPSLGEAEAALGLVRAYYYWDWSDAESHFRKALELSPGCATTRHWYGWLLAFLGRSDEARDCFREALELDPLSSIIQTNYGTALYLERRYSEAVAQISKVLELTPDFAVAHQWIGRCLEMMDDLPRAVRHHQRALEIIGHDDPESIANLAHAHGLAGRPAAAAEALERLRELGEQRYVSPYWSAMVQLGRGELDRAIELLELAHEQRTDWLMSLKLDPFFDPLRGHPRFHRLYERMAFPD